MLTLDPLKLTPQNIIPFLEDIFERFGEEEYLGESVTMAQHMLQGATLAEQEGQDDEIIVATLLHDIGHFTSNLGCFTLEDSMDRGHEEAGAQTIERIFPSIVSDCIRYHVAAKRYLCATSPVYFEYLSEASKHSLKLQGGEMSKTEVTEFEKKTNLDSIITVRYFDDLGKSPDMLTPPLGHFFPTVKRVIKEY